MGQMPVHAVAVLAQIRTHATHAIWQQKSISTLLNTKTTEREAASFYLMQSM